MESTQAKVESNSVQRRSTVWGGGGGEDQTWSLEDAKPRRPDLSRQMFHAITVTDCADPTFLESATRENVQQSYTQQEKTPRNRWYLFNFRTVFLDEKRQHKLRCMLYRIYFVINNIYIKHVSFWRKSKMKKICEEAKKVVQRNEGKRSDKDDCTEGISKIWSFSGSAPNEWVSVCDKLWELC